MQHGDRTPHSEQNDSVEHKTDRRLYIQLQIYIQRSHCAAVWLVNTQRNNESGAVNGQPHGFYHNEIHMTLIWHFDMSHEQHEDERKESVDLIIKIGFIYIQCNCCVKMTLKFCSWFHVSAAIFEQDCVFSHFCFSVFFL